MIGFTSLKNEAAYCSILKQKPFVMKFVLNWTELVDYSWFIINIKSI